MIVGIFLRYIKTYQGINYIPLTNGDSFCGLVGDNRAGKSSILESIDCFFNNKNWNINIAAKSSADASIVPVFLLNNQFLSGDELNTAKIISNIVWEVKENQINNNPYQQAVFQIFSDQRDELIENFDKNNYLLLPVGIDKDGTPHLSIFKQPVIPKLSDSTEQEEQEKEANEKIEKLVKYIKDKIDFIYIPREIDLETFTKLETTEIQVSMGEDLNKIVGECITEKTIAEINRNLKEFIDQLSEELEGYAYRTHHQHRQQNLRKNDIYKLVIEAFFSVRKLNKRHNESKWLEIGALSSGEKQKAIIDVAYNLLKNHRDSGKNLIIAIDEPESSLHISACFDQFAALFEMSHVCLQLLFASHWYGFLPTIEKGYVSAISKTEKEPKVDSINLRKYREEIKQNSIRSNGKLPYNIRLKSTNDFVQSIISSVIKDKPYNWIICEGSSDKIYFENYLKNLLKEKKIRIIPVGGAKEIKRLYEYLLIPFEEFKKEVKGKIILISDTDESLINYKTKNYPNLICKRIVNDNEQKKTRLVDISSSLSCPKTEIEDALNGKLFHETLCGFVDDYSYLQECIDQDKSVSEDSTYYALDLKPSQIERLNKFFDTNDNKVLFAKKYVSKLEEYSVPDWINEIKDLCNQDNL